MLRRLNSFGGLRACLDGLVAPELDIVPVARRLATVAQMHPHALVGREAPRPWADTGRQGAQHLHWRPFEAVGHLSRPYHAAREAARRPPQTGAQVGLYERQTRKTKEEQASSSGRAVEKPAGILDVCGWRRGMLGAAVWAWVGG